MAISAATMSNSYSSPTRRSGFLRKLVVALLFVVGIAGFMSLFYVYQKNLSFFWMSVFAILSIGLACGSVSRILFYQWSGFVRFFIVLLVLPIGLFALGVFTNWHIGIGPLNPWVKGIIPQDELIELGGSFLVAIISLEAWWKSASKIEDTSYYVETPRSSSSWRNNREQPVRAVAVSAPSIESARPIPVRQARPQSNLIFQAKGKSRLKFAKAVKKRGHTTPVTDRLVLAHTPQPTRSRRKRAFNRKPNLQISLYEEHKCPFCLEEVKRNDPRGVKKCDVCNTLHHADCWAITGFCQVPHLNT